MGRSRGGPCHDMTCIFFLFVVLRLRFLAEQGVMDGGVGLGSGSDDIRRFAGSSGILLSGVDS